MSTRTSNLRITLTAVALLAMGTAAQARQAQPDFSPTFAQPAAPAQQTANGSIFQASHGYAPLTSGTRASMVGDILTISLVERTQARKSTGQTTDRSGSIGLTPPSTGPLSFFSSSDVGMGGSQDFTGGGEAEQSNALSGEITVTIAQVFPNGTMLVRGEKQLTLNRGDEFIQISGLVRQSDVGPDNRVASTRVADAKITDTGKGDVARSSKQGWLQRFFSRSCPF